ncbi:MAG: phosphotransferase [Nanohaloarchaea archaeon]|nr:phosphotransferase [Candidatus Nanohaloarchaea archaeon]
MEQAIKDKIESALEESFEWTKIEKGLNSVYRIYSGKKKFIVKVHTNENLESENFKAEPLIYDAIQEKTDVPSPKVIHESLDDEEFSFYVMELIEGENPGPRRKNLEMETLEDLIFEYGKILGEIHREIGFESYGELEGSTDGPTVRDSSENWRDELSEIFHVYRDIVEDEWDNPPKMEIPDNLGCIPERPKPSLIHVDNRLDNLLVEDNRITGFIDWSFTRTGHNEYDLIRAEYLLIDYDLRFLSETKKERLKESLFGGYREEIDLDKDSGFKARRQLYRYAPVFWLAAGFQSWGQDLEKDAYQEMLQLIIESLKEEKPKNLPFNQ